MREELLIVEESAAATDDLEEIERLYSLRRAVEVKKFVGEHPFLVPLLGVAHSAATRYFDPLSLDLEVIAEPDSSGSAEDQQLVLFVVLESKPHEAYSKLQRFDNEWWLDAMDEAQGCLCISLEFR